MIDWDMVFALLMLYGIGIGFSATWDILRLTDNEDPFGIHKLVFKALFWPIFLAWYGQVAFFYLLFRMLT